ncbi:MAG: hypothetical protein P0107_05120 [Nitrosomonas sp.]|nr:hypothetical protein [Nitrosomonas sp.]
MAAYVYLRSPDKARWRRNIWMQPDSHLPFWQADQVLSGVQVISFWELVTAPSLPADRSRAFPFILHFFLSRDFAQLLGKWRIRHYSKNWSEGLTAIWRDHLVSGQGGRSEEIPPMTCCRNTRFRESGKGFGAQFFITAQFRKAVGYAREL